jgi:hypothetical protein
MCVPTAVSSSRERTNAQHWEHVQQVIVYKEMLMLHIVSGDYYEAYHLFKGEMQEVR